MRRLFSEAIETENKHLVEKKKNEDQIGRVHGHLE